MPSHADVHYAMGNALRKKGQTDQAIASFRKAVQFRHDFTEGYYTLGNVYEEKNMFDEAASCYREAIRIDPAHAHAHARLGFALYNRRKLDDAAAYLKKAIQLNPAYDESYSCLGMIFREKGWYDEAIAYFRKALEMNPQSAWVYTNLAATLQHKGEREEGKMYLRKAIEMNVNLQQYRDSLADLLTHDGENSITTVHPRMQTAEKILIVVPVFNRKKITALSLGQTRRYKTPYCHVQAYNDHSSEYDNAFLSSYADEVIQLPDKMGIDKLRWYQFRKFLETDFDFLYMTDNDVIHDPHYVEMLETFYAKGREKLPVSLFNNIYMLQPRLILRYENGIFVKTSAPGASMFYDRSMVKKILSASDTIGDILDYLPWDNKAVACLGLPWITPEISYLEHFGSGGLHSDNYERERAINLTEYLLERRDVILDYLHQENGVEPQL
jgi:superkiller protein 3